jgi:hypothetical protein
MSTEKSARRRGRTQLKQVLDSVENERLKRENLESQLVDANEKLAALKKRFDDYMKREEENHDTAMAFQRHVKENVFQRDRLSFLGKIIYYLMFSKK